MERRRWLRHLLRQHLGRLRPFEWQRAGKGEVPHDPEGVEVAAPVHRLAQRLLGAHEFGRADHLTAGQRRRAAHQPRNPEVGDEGAARRGLQHDVVRLHVAVHQPLRVGVCQRPGHLPQHPRCLRGRQRPAAPHPLRERLAVYVGHGEEHEVADLVDREDGNDVWVTELRGGARLAQESVPQILVPSLARRQQLDGDGAVEPHLARQIHHAHASAAELPLQRVAPHEGGLEVEKQTVEGGRRRSGAVEVTHTTP